MNRLPRHIAIVMDGNGRWAKQKNLPRLAGHRAGAKAVKKIIKDCSKLNIEALTLFAFSRENWSRPQEEVDHLMELFLQVLQKDSKELHKNNVMVDFIGDRVGLSKKLQQEMEVTRTLTAANAGLKLTIAVNYSGRWDIVNTAKSIAEKVVAGGLSVTEITEGKFNSLASLAAVPEPDLLIRTSGEFRISNFLLWQIAYTELYFTEVFWPDFNKKELMKALASFAARERRFGAIP